MLTGTATERGRPGRLCSEPRGGGGPSREGPTRRPGTQTPLGRRMRPQGGPRRDAAFRRRGVGLGPQRLAAPVSLARPAQAAERRARGPRVGGGRAGRRPLRAREGGCGGGSHGPLLRLPERAPSELPGCTCERAHPAGAERDAEDRAARGSGRQPRAQSRLSWRPQTAGPEQPGGRRDLTGRRRRRLALSSALQTVKRQLTRPSEHISKRQLVRLVLTGNKVQGDSE